MIIQCNNKIYKKYEDLLKNVGNTFVNTMQITSEIEVNVLFVSAHKIKKINRLNRSINKVTDVLSFPTLTTNKVEDISKKISVKNYAFDVNPETNAVVLGDIVFCLRKIKKQAKEYGNTLNRELGYMFVHGLLHLVGYDHMTEDDKKNMREKEELILSKINLSRN